MVWDRPFLIDRSRVSGLTVFDLLDNRSKVRSFLGTNAVDPIPDTDPSDEKNIAYRKTTRANSSKNYSKKMNRPIDNSNNKNYNKTMQFRLSELAIRNQPPRNWRSEEVEIGE